jgi:hypothetical protein
VPLILSAGAAVASVTSTTPTGEALVLDPFAEAVGNAPLWMHGLANSGVFLSADGGHSYPTPQSEEIWVSSPDTEGELLGNSRPQRRVVSVVLQIIEPTDGAATNACTNPVFAVDTAGWTNNSLTTMARSVYKQTDPALPFLSGFDTALHTAGDAVADSANHSVATQSGVAQTVSAWVWVNSGSTRLEVWTDAPAVFATGTTVLPTSAWQRVALTFTPSASATWTLRLSQVAAGTHNAWWTGVQVGPADPYFDGDTPGCDWTGARHASSSVRLASGGKRYAGIVNDLENKIAEIDAAGGTYRRTLPSGDTITFDVQKARITEETHDIIAELRRALKMSIDFTCKPYGRWSEVTV